MIKDELNNRIEALDLYNTKASPQNTPKTDLFEQALVDNSKQALRYNQGKVNWSLVDFKSLEPMVDVLAYGTKKYSRDNWRLGMPATQIIESMLRHTFALLKGERLDNESLCKHVGHIQCNAMFLAYILEEKPEFDDLPKNYSIVY